MAGLRSRNHNRRSSVHFDCLDPAMKYEVTTTVDLDPKRIQDIVCGAFEGGSNYWLGRSRVELVVPTYESLPDENVVWYGREFNVFAQDCFRITFDLEDGIKELTPETVQKGLDLMAVKYPEHFNNLVAENDDAETHDVFLQLCLFQEIVYG